jgi:hypothetical protein
VCGKDDPVRAYSIPVREYNDQFWSKYIPSLEYNSLSWSRYIPSLEYNDPSGARSIPSCASNDLSCARNRSLCADNGADAPAAGLAPVADYLSDASLFGSFLATEETRTGIRTDTD